MTHPPRRVPAFWRRRSLRFWLGAGMLLAIPPLAVCAVGGYLLYERTISAPLREAVDIQHTVSIPLQGISVTLWEAAEAVNDYAIDGNVRHRLAFRRARTAIERAFDQIAEAVEGHPDKAALIAAARQRWRTASRQAGAILADEHRGQGTIVNGEMTDFERTMARTGQALGQVFEHLDAEHERTHTQALQALGLVGMLAVGAFVVALAFMALGVWLINRSLVASTDELVQGALRLAAGDRTHMVKVRIPPELAHVANAFNSMAGQLVEQEQALAREARTDGLTGLYNRRELDRTLADELQRAERHAQPVALVLIDVDHFKRFNDSHGHLGGDDALRAVAATLRANVRAVDRVCRFGGEEFALVLPTSDAEAARVTAERIRAGIAGLAIELAGGETARVTVSLGVAVYPGDGTTPEDLLGSADAALYQSKAQGRDRVTVADGRLQASAARPAGGESG